MIAEVINTKWRDKLSRLEPLIGHTPLFPIRNVFHKEGVEIYAKLEWWQWGGSVKARPAFNIIREAVLSGDLRDGIHILDATSGNTGIAYAAIGAYAGIPVTLCLPENASAERKNILRALGAEIIYTSPLENTDGAQDYARNLFLSDTQRFFYANQYSNDHNWKAHYHSTAVEIYGQTEGKVTHFVAGLGTTGTFTGTGRRLKEMKSSVRLIALQPATVLHGLEGWKHLPTARTPGIYDPALPDEIMPVTTQGAYDLMKKVARYEGLQISPSSAANLAGAIRVAERLTDGVVVTVFPDHAERYGEVTGSLYNRHN